LGLLIEEARTNLVTYSEQFDNAAWAKSSVTVTADAIVAPDGTTTGDLIVDTVTPAIEHYVNATISTVTNQAYTQSVFVKASVAPSFELMVVAVGSSSSTSRVVFSQTAGVYSPGAPNGLITSATATSVGNGWYRCSVVYTLNGTVTVHQMRLYPYLSGLYTGTGIGTYFWGAQTEVGAFLTSYIPTVAATVTRAADVAAINTLSPWYNAAAGTMYVSYVLGADSTSVGIFRIDDGSGSNAMQMRYASGSQAQFSVTVGGVGQVNLAPSGYSAAGTYKRAIAYRVNSFNQAINGVLPDAEVTSGILPVVTRVTIGNETSSNFLNGHIARITYYPRRMSNAELQIVTNLGA
jgi:hypothetical protein